MVVQQGESEGCEEQSILVQPTDNRKPPTNGAIHIDIPGRALISVEHGSDMALLRVVLESLRK